MAEKTWMGSAPARCDVGGETIDREFVDGKTKTGPWANMCMKCFARDGIGLGAGRGQKYEKQEDGRWLKTGG